MGTVTRGGPGICTILIAVTAQRRATGVLVATCVSTLVVNANTSAVTILLPSISEDAGSSISTLQWAVTGYSLVGAACIVTSGALGDVLGRRKVFIGGLLLFIGSCVLIALSSSGLGVIGGSVHPGRGRFDDPGVRPEPAHAGDGRGRAVAGRGATGVQHPRSARPRVRSSAVSSSSSTGWQGLFWIDAAIAVACIPVTLKTVSESSDPNRSTSIDWLGTALVALDPRTAHPRLLEGCGLGVDVAGRRS